MHHPDTLQSDLLAAQELAHIGRFAIKDCTKVMWSSPEQADKFLRSALYRLVDAAGLIAAHLDETAPGGTLTLTGRGFRLATTLEDEEIFHAMRIGPLLDLARREVWGHSTRRCGDHLLCTAEGPEMFLGSYDVDEVDCDDELNESWVTTDTGYDVLLPDDILIADAGQVYP